MRSNPGRPPKHRVAREGVERDREQLGSVDRGAVQPAYFESLGEVYQIGQDFVLGMWRDESDVEHVGFYDLHKK